jgi:hypothetical protein
MTKFEQKEVKNLIKKAEYAISCHRILNKAQIKARNSMDYAAYKVKRMLKNQ